MRLVRLQTPTCCRPIEWGQLTELPLDINRWMSAALGEFTGAVGAPPTWLPALDLQEDPENLIATVDLPGVKKEALTVTVDDGVLRVSGERTAELAKDESEGYRAERFHGRFERAVALPKPVKLDTITATFKDGVLTIKLPKAEEARPRQVVVSAA